MADKKISQLDAASTPLAGTEVLPIVQSSTTKKVAVSDLTAGRAISATQLTVSTDNVIIGTAGKGIDFSVNTGAAGVTSEVLTRYEEGTWTPAVASSSGTITSVTGNVGRYTRVGRLISCICQFTIADNGTGAGALFVTGLPFVGSQTVMTFYPVYGFDRSGGILSGEYNPGISGNGRIGLYTGTGTYPGVTGRTYLVNAIYEV